MCLLVPSIIFLNLSFYLGSSSEWFQTMQLQLSTWSGAYDRLNESTEGFLIGIIFILLALVYLLFSVVYVDSKYSLHNGKFCFQLIFTSSILKYTRKSFNLLLIDTLRLHRCQKVKWRSSSQRFVKNVLALCYFILCTTWETFGILNLVCTTCLLCLF